MRRRFAQAALLVYFFLLTASFPVREGVEVGITGGRGSYEGEESESGGCGSGRWRTHTVHNDVGLSVRARPTDAELYLSAEALAGEHTDVDVIELEREGDPTGPHLNSNTLAGQAYVRLGLQYDYFGVEAGPGVVLYPAFGIPFPLPVPTAAIRVGPQDSWYAYAGLLDEPWPLYYPLHLGAGYNGDRVRMRFSLDGSGDIKFRLLDRLWFGGGTRYVAGNYFGPHFASHGTLSYQFGGPATPKQATGSEATKLEQRN